MGWIRGSDAAPTSEPLGCCIGLDGVLLPLPCVMGGTAAGLAGAPCPGKGLVGFQGAELGHAPPSPGSPPSPVPAAGPSHRHCRQGHPRGKELPPPFLGREDPNPRTCCIGGLSGQRRAGGSAGAAASFPFSFPVSRPLPGRDRSSGGSGRPPGPFLNPSLSPPSRGPNANLPLW